MPTGDKLYEDLQREREENKKAMAALVARLEEYQKQLGGMNQAQPDAINLAPQEIESFKKRLNTNLDERDKVREYLTGLLYKRTPDPTDPLADMISERSPIQMQRELKAEARQGKSKVGNFFRNLDYALGDGAGRDLGIANKIQSEARTNLDNLLKDQGTEIQRAFQMQNALAGRVAAQNQKNVSEAGKLAATQAGIANDSAEMGLKGAQVQSGIDVNNARIGRMASQNKMDEHKMQFSPFGAFEKDFNEILHLQRLREQGKGAEADLLEKEMKDRKALNYIMQMASKGGFGSTREQIIPGVDARGNVTYTKGTATSTVNNPWRDRVEKMLRSPEGKASSTLKYDEASPTTAVEQLKEAATNTAPQKKAVEVVNRAIGKSASDSQKQFIAAQGLSLGLSPDQMKNDAAKAKMGYRYTIDDASDGANVINTGMKKSGVTTADKIKPEASKDLKINSATRALIDAGAEGKLDKIFGPANNTLTALKETAEAVTPDWFSRKANPSVKSPTEVVERMYPQLTKSKDPEVQKFVNEITNLVSSSRAAVSLAESGKALTEFELKDIESRLPKLTDKPDVALQKMLNFALTERMSGYLASKGYSIESIRKVNDYIGDYIKPRIDKITEEIGNAKAYNASGAVKSRKAAVRHLDFKSIDPEDILGDAIYSKVKAAGGSLRDFEQQTGIRIRRLIPDGDMPTSGGKSNSVGSPSVKPKSAEERMEEIRRKYGVK